MEVRLKNIQHFGGESMNIDHIIELSHKMRSGKENFKLEVTNYPVEEIMPQIKRQKDLWYILSEVTMSSHVGTHIEFPYHHLKEGQDAASFPLGKLIGQAVVLDFSYKKAGEAITLDELKAYGHKINKKDILLVRTDYDKFWRTKQWEECPYITTEGVQWLIEEKQIRCLGTDAVGVEVPGTDYQPNHSLLFKNNIPMIESMTNLGSLQKERFLIIILPLPIEGLDSSPVRIIAIEE